MASVITVDGVPRDGATYVNMYCRAGLPSLGRLSKLNLLEESEPTSSSSQMPAVPTKVPFQIRMKPRKIVDADSELVLRLMG
jgi:hypothetical protein